ncbi:TetR/AcrR family transcriptional regulator [Kribbella albertanoniae]|uniref:TetR/AcrR family transcriptional regulator n=1 Tax=Kribbella albertanoniae TaxID=1266829 RepID=A0A4R4PKX4_9ACTN|nr:TetR/AcrR family transcriptional regulator [Kribbella albertanoniae]TDC22599.1 TetR/AcrR family transcriptional regulator [Kribbella albertanoniae]
MDPRAERTIESLLRAAEPLFRQRPFAEVTLEEIAADAGVAVGSVYNHFGSKAGLHAALVERALDTDRYFMDLAYVPGRSPIDQLYAAAAEYLAFYLANPEFFRMLAFPSDPGSYPAGRELADRLAASVNEQNARMVEAIKLGIDTGVLREVDPDATATVLWAAWNGIISLGWRSDSLSRTDDELAQLLRVATDLVAHGLLVD